MQKSYVYIMSNKYRTVLYIGVTADVQTRVWQHKSEEVRSLLKSTMRYFLKTNVRFAVYFVRSITSILILRSCANASINAREIK